MKRLVALAVVLLGASSAHHGGTTGIFGVWIVHTGPVDFNQKTGVFSTATHISMTRKGGDVSADRATGNQKRHIITFYGNVVVHDSGGFSMPGTASVTGDVPATLLADRLQVDSKARVYVATGHVHYTKGSTVIDAEQATLDDAAHTMHLEGHVHMLQGANSIWADSIVYDTLTGQGTATASRGILQFPARTP